MEFTDDLTFFVYPSIQFEVDLSRATGAAEIRDDFISKLSRIVQLTGEFVALKPLYNGLQTLGHRRFLRSRIR